MKFIVAFATVILAACAAHPAGAALAVGDPAPDFSADGAVGGASATVALSELLKKGSTVLFFFPSAFTDAPECREFAEYIDKFRAAGVSVVGASRDSVDTLAGFSTKECGGQFPLASASQAMVNGFDVNDGAMFNTRTTYVIAPSGKIAFVDDNADYDGHAKSALDFVLGVKK